MEKGKNILSCCLRSSGGNLIKCGDDILLSLLFDGIEGNDFFEVCVDIMAKGMDFSDDTWSQSFTFSENKTEFNFNLKARKEMSDKPGVYLSLCCKGCVGAVSS